jgi:Holliday junction resolvasome RuvABC endonuclease subunit
MGARMSSKNETEGRLLPGTIIVGIDPSLLATGLVVLNSKGEILKQLLIENKVITYGTYKNGNQKTITQVVSGNERLKLIRDRVMAAIKEYNVTAVAIEGYAFAAGGKGRIVSLGELGGVLRLSMHDAGMKIFEISPNSLKAFVTGNGNADKEMMMESTDRRFGVHFSDDNICDAYGLARFVLEFGDKTPEYTKAGGAKKIRAILFKK